MNSPLRILPLGSLPEHLAAAASLYESAFPEAERRDTAEWKKLVLRAGPLQALAGLSGDRCCGFITLWDFQSFAYVEHFAVCSDLRGQGTGSLMLRHVQQRLGGQPLILEVEMPENETARRRVAFYERHGFSLVGKPYAQPPYRAGGEWLPLRLMSDRPEYAVENFDCIRDTLYEQVYAATGGSDLATRADEPGGKSAHPATR